MPTFGRAASSTTATITPSAAASATGWAGNGTVVVSFVLALEIFSVVLISTAT